MDYQLIKVRPDKVDEAHEVLKKCGEDMKLRFGLEHWVPPYPIHLLRKDAEEKSVYAVYDDDKILATFTISAKRPEYYDINIWESPKGKAIYVNRLAVLPEFQGKGTGIWCMKTIERMTTEMGCVAVRLDAVENHVKLLNFYGNLGYQRKGIVRFQKPKLVDAVCFEKVLIGK